MTQSTSMCRQYVAAREDQLKKISSKIAGMVDEAAKNRKSAKSLATVINRFNSLCVELDARSAELSSSYAERETQELENRKKLSESCQVQIAELSKQVDMADDLRRVGLEQNECLRKQLQELLADFDRRQAEHDKITMPQAARVVKLKEQTASFELEAEEVRTRIAIIAEAVATLAREQRDLQDRLTETAAGFESVEDAKLVHEKLSENRSMHEASARRALSLEKERRTLTQQCSGLEAAIERLQKRRELVMSLKKEQVELQDKARQLHSQQREDASLINS